MIQNKFKTRITFTPNFQDKVYSDRHKYTQTQIQIDINIYSNLDTNIHKHRFR